MTGRPIPTEHGTSGYQQYWDCRCAPCTKAMGQYRKGLALDQSRGKSRRADVGPIREHVQRLLKAGASVSTIAKATDGAVTHVQVQRIIDGTTKRFVLLKAAEALMALPVGSAIAEHRMVSTVGLRRRVEALHALGYTKDEIGESMGHTGSFICDLCSHETVTRRSHSKVVAAYESLAGKPGGSELQRWRGIREGWPPPMAWDDESIDDPEAEPNWRWVRCVGPGCTTHVYKQGLCHHHYNKLRKMGRLSPPVRFRTAVLQHCRRTNHSRSHLHDDLVELRELGFTIDGAAARLNKSRSVVEREWWGAA